MEVRKVGIIGVGHVGAHVALSLVTQGICDELWLCDINEQKAISERQDLIDSICYLPHRVNVRVGSYEDLAVCDVIVISVGTIDPITQDRLAELQRSVDLVRTFVPRLKKAGFSGLYLSITNPCDIIAYEVYQLSGLDASRVIGTGTGLDTARFKAILAEKTGYDHKSISAYMLGEHGDSQMAAWSAVSFGGKRLAELEMEQPDRFTFDKEAISEQVKQAAWVTYAGKHATEFGIASTAARMIHCIFHDEKQIVPASTLMNGQYGEYGLYASVPVVLGKDGIEEVIRLNLSDEEKVAFQHTCQVMRAHIAKIQS